MYILLAASGSVVAWLLLGYLGGAFAYAYNQRTFPLIAAETKRADKLVATALTLLGLFGLVGAVIGTFLFSLCDHRYPCGQGLMFRWPWS